MRSERWKLHLSVAVLAIAAMTLALTPAIADPLPGTDEYPDVAFLARNDVPFDAQTAASAAAQLGAPMFITTPDALSDAAADGISNLNPDVLIVAGGTAAISDAVANEAAAQCDPDCTVDRRFGTGRDETAAAIAGIAVDYGFDRPVLQGSNQVVGDVHIGGTVHTDAITVQDTGLVSGLNADRVDGMHASDFLGATDQAADSDLLDGKDSTEFENIFAVVAADGTIIAGNGLTDAVLENTGDFTLTFNQAVNGCAWTGTIGARNGATTSAARTITLNGGGTTADNVIRVKIMDGAGGDVSNTFNVAVHC